MKTSLFFKQKKPLTVIILGIVLFILGGLVLVDNGNELTPPITMFSIGVILLGYSVSFEIRETLNHKRHFKLFGVTIYMSSLEFFAPEYIVVFSATYSKSSEWGPVSALGKENKENIFVIRFFKGSQKFTLWRTNSFELAKTRATNLGELLNVEVRS